MPRKPNLAKKDNYNGAFPTALRNLMDERRITQEEMKVVLGLANRQSVTGYVDGSTSPTPEKIIALADRYHVSADYLLGRGELPDTTEESRTAAAYTGLSEKAVAVLHELNEKPKSHGLYLSMNPAYMRIASALITSPSFSRLLESLDTINTIINDSIIHEQLDDNIWDEDGYIDKDGIREIKYSVFDCTETLQDVIDELYHTRAIFKGAANEQG